MKKIIQLLVLITLAVLSTGCATLLGGWQNRLIIQGDSQPLAKVYLDDVYIGDAPGKITLPRKQVQHGSILEIKADGYQTQQITLMRKAHPAYIAGDVVFGAVWLAFDMANGNIYKPYPQRINYQLKTHQ